MAGHHHDKKPSRKGELRRRWRAFLEDGSIASLRSEGRLVALYVLQVADWSTCEVRFTYRRAARCICVHVTSVRRGVSQLVEAGILEVLEKSAGPGKTKYRICERAQRVSTPDTSRARLCTRAVPTPDTSGARSGHEPCAQRTPVVRAARTGRVHGSVFLSGSPVRTSEKSSEATAMAGAGPARPCRTQQDSDSTAVVDGGSTTGAEVNQ